MSDSGAGSLRQALADAAAANGVDTITFATNLSGQTIVLTGGSLSATDSAGVTIDATALPAGLVIKATGTDRAIFNSGVLTLRGLTFTGASLPSGNGGGAIYSTGTLTNDLCVFSNNVAPYGGGAMFNDGTVSFSRCTLSGNSGGTGGALYNRTGAMTLDACTLCFNSASGNAGAIYAEANTTTLLHQCTVASNSAAIYMGAMENLGSASLTHCTLVGNIGVTAIGCIYNQNNLTLNYSILAGNTGANGADLQSDGTVTVANPNIIATPITGTGTTNGSGPIITADPLLKTLGYCGGPTQTMPPLAGSPAIDQATGSTETNDQRSYPRPIDGDANGSAINDLGAVEFAPPNANLANLAVSAGVLSPSFDSAATNYSVSVAFAISGITITPTAVDAHAVITVNAIPVVSGAASGSISLQVGTNVITTAVTATDGVTTKTYNLTVIRDDDIQRFVVTTNADAGAGSLRQALASAADFTNAVISFDTALSGQTITLTTGALSPSDTNGVAIDASALPGGITIDGNGADRDIVNTGSLILRAVTLTGAFIPDGFGGGAVLNYGTVTIERCTIAHNIAGYGAAVWTEPGATTTLRECTVAGNYASVQSGAIENRGTTSLRHCTISANGSANVGGIINEAGASLYLENSIISGNTDPDIDTEGDMTGAGSNIVATAIAGGGNNAAAATIIQADPVLSALGNYGGPTQTIVPSTYSPAIDSAVTSSETTDQRGFVRPVDGDGDGSTLADIGAVELASGDSAYLANLVLGAGSFIPAFNNASQYSATVPNETTTTTVTPTAVSPDATITVNGVVVASGSASSAIPLNVGSNTITVVVVPAAAVITNTYVISVYRADNANLTGLTLSAGSLVPAFASATTIYGDSVANAVTNLTITPTAALTNATITVNGVTVVSGNSINIALNEGANNITTVVTAPDSVSTKTYVVTVFRAIIVSSTANGGAGSLRQAVAAASASSSPATITFAPALSGQTITLTTGEIHYDNPASMTIDASALPGGIVINAHGASRIFENGYEGVLTLRALTLTGGNASLGGQYSGGAINNSGNMTLDRCTLSANTATFGGALNSVGNLTLERCTIVSNTAADGGALSIYGAALVCHCTICGNSANTCGGVYLFLDDGNFRLENSIVAGNTGSGGPDICFFGGFSLIIAGANLVGTPIYTQAGYTTGSIVTSGTISTAAPLLAPLGNYGGPTQTMPPLTGSPAIDSAVGSTETIDQRGYPRPLDGDGNGVAVADIGAVEFISANVTVPPISQTVPAGANAQFAVTAQTDNPPLHYQWLFNGNAISGATNFVLNLTNVNRANAGTYSVIITSSAASVTNGNAALHVLVPQNVQSLIRDSGGLWSLSFNDTDGALLATNNLADFTVQFSTNLVDWVSFTNNLTLANGHIVFTDQSGNSVPKRFFRVLSK